jgi:hypothetical protein
MNITFLVDDKVVEQARHVARALNKSLAQLVREYLEQLAGGTSVDDELSELRGLSMRNEGWLGDKRADRDELHERA